MLKKFIFSIVIILLIIAAAFWGYTRFYRGAENQLLTYFKYPYQETSKLNHLSTSLEITSDDLKKWDLILFDLIRKNKVDADSSRIYAYVYTAQRDVAFLSYNTKKQFSGSIGPISKMVLCQFFPDNCDAINLTDSDEYSQKLADIVFDKVKSRIQEDKKNEKSYPEKNGANHWKGNKPYFGQTFGSWKTWLITSSSQFRAPEPPSESAWRIQVHLVKQQRSAITEKQKKSVVYWAGGPGTVTPPGIWLTTVNEYMFSHNVPMQKVLLVRSVLSMAIADAIIAVFDSKYTYYQLRPYMRDHTIQTIMPTPNHPSYPAAHSAVSATAANILLYYFPEEKHGWINMGKEGSQGRVWGAIHFPIDVQVGEEQGKKIANFIIQYNKDGVESHE